MANFITAYYKAASGKDCPNAKIIRSFESCVDAKNFLGLHWGGEHWSTDDPAGCYWKDSSSSSWNYAKFNWILDPSETTNSKFDDDGADRGGICNNIGKCSLNVCCNHIFIQYNFII